MSQFEILAWVIKQKMSKWTANFKLMVPIPSCKTDLWPGKTNVENSFNKNNVLLQILLHHELKNVTVENFNMGIKNTKLN